MANTVDLQSSGECIGGGGGGNGTCIDKYARDVQNCKSAYGTCLTGCAYIFPITPILQRLCEGLCELAQISCGTAAYGAFLDCARN